MTVNCTKLKQRREQSILDAAQRTSDLDLQHRVLHDQFQENVQYHSICITKYLLRKHKS